jgi:hypothetical protein
MWRRSLLILALILAACAPPPPTRAPNDKPVDITICREVYIVTCWGK